MAADLIPNSQGIINWNDIQDKMTRRKTGEKVLLYNTIHMIGTTSKLTIPEKNYGTDQTQMDWFRLLPSSSSKVEDHIYPIQTHDWGS